MAWLNRRALLFAVVAVLLLAAGAVAQDQYRVFWVDTFNTPLNNYTDVQNVVANARAANANAIFAQVRRRGDSWYRIGGEPLPDPDSLVHIEPDFDPLQTLIDEAHRYGIELHAYVIVNAIWNKHPVLVGVPSSPKHIFNQHAWDPITKAVRTDSENWLTKTTLPDTTGSDTSIRFGGYRFGSDFWIDLGHPDAAAYTANLFIDLVRNYKGVDGLHLDRIRYPELTVPSTYPKQTPANGTYIGYNQTSVARFNQRYSLPAGNVPAANDPAWSQWRRDQVSNFVRRIYLNALAINPQLKISASTIVFGGAPSTWTGAEAYWRVYQDWRQWLDEGILDINAPMNYKYEHKPGQPAMLDGWNEFARNNQYNRMTIMGMGLYLNFVECSLLQMRRTLAPSAVTGNTLGGLALFSMANSSIKNTSATYSITDPCSIPPGEIYPPGKQLSFAEFAAAVTTGKSVDGSKLYEDPAVNPVPIFAFPVNPPILPWKANLQTGHLMGFIKDETGAAVDAGDFSIARIDDGTTPSVGRTQVPNASTVASPNTDGNGFYGGVDLAPGQYRVTVTPAGQAPYTMQCATVVNAGHVTSFDFTIDRQLPTTTLEATPNRLWPPDSRTVFVTISGAATDAGTGLDSIAFKVIDEYGQVQPEVAPIDGWGKASLDWSVSIPLEASRLGEDIDGRTYTIEVTVKDRACNVKTVSTAIVVEHDQRPE